MMSLRLPWQQVLSYCSAITAAFSLGSKSVKDLCNKYFDGMDSKQMAAVVEQALAAWFEGKEAAVV